MSIKQELANLWSAADFMSDTGNDSCLVHFDDLIEILGEVDRLRRIEKLLRCDLYYWKARAVS